MLTMFYSYNPMLDLSFDRFKIQVSSFVNRLGNTSYMLDVFDRSRGGMFVYSVVRYQWNGGSCYYLIADSDGYCFPAPCSVRCLVPGFNWSYVRRALRDGANNHSWMWFPF